ncbi:MAG: cysteine synthase family protein [Chloroflexi bacterium]|nr:cysteine synthase family protein [Chloroflexota bacterium]
MRFASLEETIGNTPLVELPRMSPRPEVRLFAKLEWYNPTGSVKDRIAKYMLDRAEASGLLTHDRIILEPTSGNTGIALAMLAHRRGYHMMAVMPENVSQERRALLEMYGAEMKLTDGARGSNGAIEVAEQIASNHPEFYMPYQYGNPANPQAHYETTGPEIIRDLPEVDVFVAGLGTGGTLMGVGRRLKEHNPSIQIVAAEPHPGEQVQGLRSLGDGFVPPILDLALLDRKLVVTSDDALHMTRVLTDREGLFAGLSSGAVLHAAIRLAQRMERGNIVCLLADGGAKYLSTGVWTQPLSKAQEELRTKVWW